MQYRCIEVVAKRGHVVAQQPLRLLGFPLNHLFFTPSPHCPALQHLLNTPKIGRAHTASALPAWPAVSSSMGDRFVQITRPNDGGDYAGSPRESSVSVAATDRFRQALSPSTRSLVPRAS